MICGDIIDLYEELQAQGSGRCSVRRNGTDHWYYGDQIMATTVHGSVFATYDGNRLNVYPLIPPPVDLGPLAAQCPQVEVISGSEWEGIGVIHAHSIAGDFTFGDRIAYKRGIEQPTLAAFLPPANQELKVEDPEPLHPQVGEDE